MTVNHVKGATLVMPDGTLVETGGITEDNPGYDLTGLVVGNEGTFGIVIKAVVNLTRDPEAGRTLLAVGGNAKGRQTPIIEAIPLPEAPAAAAGE